MMALERSRRNTLIPMTTIPDEDGGALRPPKHATISDVARLAGQVTIETA